MEFTQVLHRGQRKQTGAEPVSDTQLLKEWPEMKCYATCKMNRILPGFRIGKNVSDDKLIKA